MPFPAKCIRLLLSTTALAAISTAGIAAERSGATPITPKTGAIKLLDGNESHGLYTWLKDTSYSDPRKVFRIENGTLHISGEGLGYIGTKDEYRDYRLVLEFRWGKHVWGSRKHRTRDSGLFLHAGGRDGRLMPVALTAEVTRGNVWKKGAERRTFSTTSCIQWFGHDPDWKDVTGFRGKDDVESPLGEWTRMEVVCRGGHIVVRVNGAVVNEATDAQPSAGKILIQCELTELHVRRWELWPLDTLNPVNPRE